MSQSEVALSIDGLLDIRATVHSEIESTLISATLCEELLRRGGLVYKGGMQPAPKTTKPCRPPLDPAATKIVGTLPIMILVEGKLMGRTTAIVVESPKLACILGMECLSKFGSVKMDSINQSLVVGDYKFRVWNTQFIKDLF